MSPTTKKILMIGGAAVAGYLIYTKVIKKSAPAAPAAAPAGAIVGGMLAPPGSMHAFDPRAVMGMRRTETLQDIERELAGQSLGSLGRI